MTTLFDDFDAALSDAVDDLLGEAALLKPRTTPAYTASSVDASRAQVTVRGVLSDGPEAKVSGGQYFSAPLVQDMIADFWIAAEAAAQIPYDIVAGDRLQMSARAGLPEYMISGVHQTHQGDLHLMLVEHDGT